MQTFCGEKTGAGQERNCKKMTGFLKFRLLLWKNYLIQKRKPVATAFEIGLPILFGLILMLLRLRVSSTFHHDPVSWPNCPFEYLDMSISNKLMAYSPMNEATTRVMTTISQIYRKINISKYFLNVFDSQKKNYFFLINSTQSFFKMIRYKTKKLNVRNIHCASFLIKNHIGISI